MVRQKYFILTSGRSGSTLLSSILSDAGAYFGMNEPGEWNRGGGAYEHPLIIRAAQSYRSAHRLSEDRPAWPRNWLWSILRHQGKRHLRTVLPQASFFKALHLELAIQPIFKLGYFPRIIVSHRSFAPQALSLARTFSERTINSHELEYLRTYRNALIWLHTYGGCVVDYDDLADLGCTDWIGPLADLTGLPAEAFVQSRGRRVTAAMSETPPPALGICDEVLRIEKLFKDLRGRLIPPSHAALRSWQHMAPDAEASFLIAQGHLRST